jgi:hypothetical protein
MPLQLSRVDQKILFIAAGVFMALVVAAWILVPDSDNETIPSTYSSGISGAKAAYLLLQETGYPVERWEQPIAQIGSGGNKTLILAEPNRLANKEEQAALSKFIDEGGRLIAIGPIAGLFLPQDSILPDPVGGLGWKKYSALAPSSITRAAPEITMAPRAHWSSPSSALGLYGEEKKPIVATYSCGKGKVIWWAAATPLTNAGLKEPGNLEFFLACLGDKSSNRIFWDEYYHGYSRSAKASYENKLTAGILAQLALLAIAIGLTFSRRSGPLRPSAPEIRLSPLEFVETLGGLYEHARASNVAVDISYQRFVYWLAKRLGLSAQASVEQLEQAARSRWQFHDEQFAILLRECASVRYLPSLQPRRALQLVRDLHSYAVKFDLFPASAKENL